MSRSAYGDLLDAVYRFDDDEWEPRGQGFDLLLDLVIELQSLSEPGAVTDAQLRAALARATGRVSA